LETKICTKCKEEKPTSDFCWKNKEKKILHSNCKVCQRKAKRDYYKRNSKEEYKRVKKRRDKIAKWFKNYKSTLECEKCGANHIAVITFHHKNPNNKENNITTMVSDGHSKENIKKEIDKCQVLCANCHRKLHWKD